MTDFMKEASENPDFNYSMYSMVFKKTFEILANVGIGIFQSKNHEFSTAIFDTTTIGIAENIHFYGNANSSEIRDRIATIKKDEYYQKITRSGGNNSVQRVKRRLEFAKTIFGQK